LGDGECTPWTLPGPIFSSKLADTAENEHHQFSLKECNKNHQKIEIFENLPNSQGTSGMVKYHTKTPREAWMATLKLEKSGKISKKKSKIFSSKIQKSSIYMKGTSPSLLNLGRLMSMGTTRTNGKQNPNFHHLELFFDQIMHATLKISQFC